MNFRPSKAHRWAGGGCTGSVAAESAHGLIETTSPNAEEGKRLHALAAATIYEGPHPDTSAEDHEIITPYVDDVLDALNATHGTGQLALEKQLTSGRFKGTPDAYLLAWNKLIVWDFKTGRCPVEAFENWQLLLYACMILEWDFSLSSPVEVELRIVQPTAYHPDGPVRVWRAPNLRHYANRIYKAVDEAEDNPQFVATPSNCLYCKAVTNCPAARNVTLGALDMAASEVGPLDAAAVASELQTLRTAAGVVKARLASMEAEAEARLKSGEFLPGCGASNSGPGKWVWDAEHDEVVSLCALYGHNAELVTLRTPTQMRKAGMREDVLNEITKRTTPKLSVTTDVKNELEKIFK